MNAIDPATIEIIRYGMLQAADEMKVKLLKTSIDPLLYIAKDFSCGVFNAKGELIAQAQGLPHFLANLGMSITSTAEDIGGFDMFEEGDVYMINDPYRVVAHAFDIDVLSPVFHDGKLVGFAACRAHWTDIGSATPFIMTATELFQEGVQYPSIRAYKNGEPIPDILRMVKMNSRLPESSERNLRAQAAANMAGRERMLTLIKKYGVDTFLSALDGILKHGEEMARECIRSIPNGEYSAQGYVDDDGYDLDTPLKVSVKVLVEDETMTVDLTGSNEKVRGSMNSGRTQTITACRMELATLMTSGFPINEGVFKPLHVIIPPGSLFDAKKPSATFIGYQAGDVAKELMNTALASSIPDKVCASDYGDATNIVVYGYSKEGNFYSYVGVHAGGGGGKPYEDGEDALIFGDLANIPIEVVEKMHPIKMEKYHLRQNSEGPGKYRGGFGLVLELRILDEECYFSSLMARYSVPTFGILGGQVPPLNLAQINPDTPNAQNVSRASGVVLKKGDLVRLVTSGGGGYGDPMDRDPDLVRLDAVRELITIKHAEECYGVIFEEGPDLKVDISKTMDLRRQIRDAR